MHSCLVECYSYLASAFFVTLVGVIIYVALYTPLKRVSPHATIVGAVAGAVPPVVGYGAAVGVLDTVALLLFILLVSWQMVHFFAIALYREEDYRAAGIPVMPVVIGAPRTRLLMAVYAAVFAFAVGALYLVAPLSFAYLVLMGTLSLLWLTLTLSYPLAADVRRWARQVFFSSIAILISFCFAIALL
jgi:heme o synthase